MRSKNPGKTTYQHYLQGNPAARYILMTSMAPSLAVSLFGKKAESVDAASIYRELIEKFEKSNGGLKNIMVAKFMRFKYQDSLTSDANLFKFTQIL